MDPYGWTLFRPRPIPHSSSRGTCISQELTSCFPYFIYAKNHLAWGKVRIWACARSLSFVGGRSTSTSPQSTAWCISFMRIAFSQGDIGYVFVLQHVRYFLQGQNFHLVQSPLCIANFQGRFGQRQHQEPLQSHLTFIGLAGQECPA